MAQYGGFWRRVLAYIIDAIIVNVAGSLVGFVVGLALGLQMQSGGADTETFEGAAGLAGGVLGLVSSWLYFAILESSSMQGTLGKKALGMIVTDLDGGRIGFGRATGRYFAKILSGIILLIGFIMVAFTERKQGLHDMIVGTLVFKASSSSELNTSAAVFE